MGMKGYSKLWGTVLPICPRLANIIKLKPHFSSVIP
jgi:hypothetical protein